MVRDVSSVPLRTSSERLSSPAPERLDTLRRFAIDGNYSPLWVASLDGTNPNDNNAWIRLDFRWYPQRINVLRTGKIFDILSSLLKAFSTPAKQGQRNTQKNIPAENAGSLKGSWQKLQPVGQAGCPHLEPRNNAFYWRQDGQGGAPTATQGIPVHLFAGFTGFHGAGISTINSTHTGVCVPGTERNAWELHLVLCAQTFRIKSVRTLVIEMSEEEWRQFCRIKVLEGPRKDFFWRKATEELS